MNKLLTSTAVAVVLAMAGSSVANAEDNAEIKLELENPEVCEIGGTVAADGSSSTITGDTESATAIVGEEFFNKDFVVDITWSEAECNTTPVLKFNALNGVLQNSAAACGGSFATELKYTLNFSLGGDPKQTFLSGDITAGADTEVINVDEPFLAEELELEFKSEGGGPFCAGTYTETVTVSLGKAV
jgi:hypothetical protein